MRPLPKTPGSESYTFRSGGDYVRIELNNNVLRAAERAANDLQYVYLVGAAQLVRIAEFLQLVIDGLRHVQTNKDTVAFVFRSNHRWVRVEENNQSIELSERQDEDDEYVYSTGAAYDALVAAFVGYSARQLDVNSLGLKDV